MNVQYIGLKNAENKALFRGFFLSSIFYLRYGDITLSVETGKFHNNVNFFSYNCSILGLPLDS